MTHSCQVLFIKLFGNSNEQTKSMFRDRLAVRSTPCFIAFKDKKVCSLGFRVRVRAYLSSGNA